MHKTEITIGIQIVGGHIEVTIFVVTKHKPINFLKQNIYSI